MEALLLALFLGAEPPRTDSLGDPLPAGVLRRLGRTRFVQPDFIGALALSPDGTFLVSSFRHYPLDFEEPRSGAIYLWDGATGKLRARWDLPGEQPRDLKVSPDGKTLAVAQGTASLWDLKTQTRLHHFETLKGCERVWFSGDGKELIAKLEGEVLVFLDLASGKEILRWQAHEPDAKHIPRIEVGPDGRVAWSEWQPGKVDKRGRNDGNVSCWYAFPRHDKKPTKLATFAGSSLEKTFSPCGRLLAVFRLLGAEYSLRLLSVPSGEVIWESDGRDFARPMFAPDGRLFVNCKEQLREVDLETGRLAKTTIPLPVHGYGWCWSADGSRVACVDALSIRVWDRQGGREILACPGPGPGSRIVFSTDGALHALSRSNQFSAWDLATGRQLVRWPIVFKPRDPWDTQRDTLLWDFQRGKAVIHEGGQTHLVDLLDAAPRQPIDLEPPEKEDSRSLTPDGKKIYLRRSACGVFSPDGKTVYLETKEGACRVFDCASGKLLRTIPWDKTKTRFAHTAIAPDGRFAVGWDGSDSSRPLEDNKSRLTLIDLSDGKPLKTWEPFAPIFHSGSKWILPSEHSLQFSRDGRLLLALPANATNVPDTPVGVWAMPSGELISEFLLSRVTGGPDFSIPVAFDLSPDGRTVAFSFARDPRIHLWEIATGGKRAVLPGHLGSANLTFSADGKTLASSSADGTVLLWDLGYPRSKKRPIRTDYSPEELLQFWADLSDRNAETGNAAREALTAAPKQAVAFLRTRLKAASEFSRERVKELLAQLGSEKYPVRAKAQAELEALQESVAPLLIEELRGAEMPLERRRRIERLLATATSRKITPERLRHSRVLEILEGMDSAESRDLLRELANGQPDALLTQEARASLGRMKRGGGRD